MIYKQFLLSSGGGIIDRNALVDYSGPPTLFIGLGGTGIDCLKEIKKKVYSRIKPRESDSSNLEYGNIQFLGVDSDSMSVLEKDMIFDIDRDTEFLDISSEIVAIMPGIKVHKKILPQFNWLNYDGEFPVGKYGSGCIRQIGRLLLFLNIEKTIEMLRQKISCCLRDNVGHKINIHIFSGMSGGTGSGIFLDFCYILQFVLEEYGMLCCSDITGYLFSAEMTLSKRGGNSFLIQQFRANTVAFMKELDNCMEFDGNKGEWSQLYSENFKIESKRPPVYNAFLIDGMSEDHSIVPYEYVLGVVTESIISNMTTIVCEDFCDISWFGFVKDKIIKMAKMRTQNNKNLKYMTVGASSVRVPIKEIYTYCASKILLSLKKYETNAKAFGVDSFIDNAGLTYASLLNELYRNVPSIPIYEVETRTLVDQVMGNTPDVIPSVLSQMRDALPKIQGALTSNRESQVQSVIVDIKNKLIEIATVQGKGPVYASLFLNNSDRNAKDFGNFIDGYIKENNDNLSYARGDLTLREERVATTLRELQNAKMNKNRKAKNYVSAVHSYFTQLAKISLYIEMNAFLSGLLVEVRQLYLELFLPLNKIMKNLSKTAEHNCEYFFCESNVEDEWSLFSKEEITSLGDEYLENIDTEKIIFDLTLKIIDSIKHGETESQIIWNISESFSNVFCDLGNKGIDYWLAIKYGANSEFELRKVINEQLLNRIKEKSSILFMTEYPQQNDISIDMCYVNESSSLLIDSLDDFIHSDLRVVFQNSKEINNISLVQMKPCESIANRKWYKNAYENAMNMKGLHLYDNTTLAK